MVKLTQTKIIANVTDYKQDNTLDSKNEKVSKKEEHCAGVQLNNAPKLDIHTGNKGLKI